MQERALVIDDHPLVCDALQLAIQLAAPHMLVEQAHSIAGMHAAVRPERDLRLIVLDLMLPDARGFSGLLIAQKTFPEARIAIVSARDDDHTIGLAAAFGAAGYIVKTTPLTRMTTAFRQILAGEPIFPDSAATARTGVGAQPTRLAKAFRNLSAAQLRVLVALADGRPTKIAAHDLGISEAGVKAHLTQLFRLFEVGNRSQLVLVARPLLGSTETVAA